MFKYLLITTALLFATNLASERGPDINYCEFPCGIRRFGRKNPHTICRLKHKCEVSSKCIKFENLPFSESEKDSIVQTHNKLRNLIALGKGCVSKEEIWFPPASSMRELVWDRELEFQAQCWANQCIMEHDTCRRKYDGQYAGQNLVWIKRESVIPALHSLFNECRNLSVANVDSYGVGFEWGGHFTQMVYWNTTQIGCARVMYELRHRSARRVMFLCNYAWVGNWVGQPVYIKGRPASQCPEGSKRHVEFKGLCTTEPSKSKVPNICNFAKDKQKCIPYLSMVEDTEKLSWNQNKHDKHEGTVDFCDKKYTCRLDEMHTYIHTICEVDHNCKKKPNCLESPQLSQDEKREILNKHNEYRNQVALGIGNSSNILPKASNMQELVWDEELEFLAQCLANQCIYQHDKCTKRTDETFFGQNIAFGTYHSITVYVKKWFEEYKVLSDISVLDYYMPQNPAIGHLTQLVYGESKQLGCAKSKINHKKWTGDLLICNYGPAGNIKEHPIYIKGNPCKQCSCHNKYKGLCRTEPSTSKQPSICKPDDSSCGPILDDPGLKQGEYHHYEHHKWDNNYKLSRVKKPKETEKQKFVEKSDGVSKKNSFIIIWFVGCITVTCNFLL